MSPPTNAQMEELRSRVTKLETLVGDSPNEGLRADIQDLKHAVQSMEKRMYMALGGCAVIYFLVQRVFT